MIVYFLIFWMVCGLWAFHQEFDEDMVSAIRLRCRRMLVYKTKWREDIIFYPIMLMYFGIFLTLGLLAVYFVLSERKF